MFRIKDFKPAEEKICTVVHYVNAKSMGSGIHLDFNADLNAESVSIPLYYLGLYVIFKLSEGKCRTMGRQLIGS